MKDLAPINRRILLIDDNPAIHEDFRKVLTREDASGSTIDQEADALFGQSTSAQSGPIFQLESAFQGEEALAKVRQAEAAQQPYAMAFVDMRMPPGWDGLETIRHLWQEAPDLETVICTAYSDHSWQDIQQALGTSDRLLILKKPFDKIEVIQLALALTEKWNLRRLARLQTDGLEELVRLRTRELLLAHRSKSEFLTNISHELLTPMNGIIGMASLLEEAPLEDEHREYLADLQHSGQRLLRLIQDVLTFNTIEAGKLLLDPVDFDAHALCQSVVQTQVAKARAKGLEISTSLDEDLSSSHHGDPAQIKNILSLLLDNAIKFTQRGLIQVCVRKSSSIPPAVEIAIIDTGCGLAPEQIDSFQHPFCQLDGSATRKAEGIGMGLTLVKQLLRVMGSRLEIQSQPGHGSTFSFLLPAAASMTIPAAQAA